MTQRIDVATPLGTLATSWSLAAGGGARPVLVCIPGGTYTGAYFDLHVPEDPTYSFVAHANAAGWSTLCVDQLGTGASARPADREVGFDEQADAVSHALGVLASELGATAGFVAVGHSMGGYTSMRQQARHRDYRAVAILGTTNDAVVQLQLPDEMRRAAADRDTRRALVEQVASSMPEPYLDAGRDALGDWFHLPDVPAAVRRADLTTLTVVPRRAAAESTVPHTFVDDASTIDVPVLLAYGELDVSPDPRREPGWFTSSDDLTLVVLRGSAHCHNMASTRRLLWDRILGWASVATAPGA